MIATYATGRAHFRSHRWRAFFKMIFQVAERFRQQRKIHCHPPGLVFGCWLAIWQHSARASRRAGSCQIAAHFCAHSARKISVGAQCMGSFTMKGNRDGQKPWSEDDLFDLDSALCCGGDIEDIADFLSREVVEVERKASERNLLEPAERRQAAA
jgi:hypothetical protein